MNVANSTRRSVKASFAFKAITQTNSLRYKASSAVGGSPFLKGITVKHSQRIVTASLVAEVVAGVQQALW